ncbi:LysR family transcriptional regulator [Abyssibacter sp.]|uniref:LysR family transcriptional regulator n=1 Tax=Abyssibacter sp. TaxID=2320200 RepID=UPI00321C1797
MDRFLAMQTFVAVVDAGSFVAAADRLGQSKASTSRHVTELEAHLGVRLLQRTTRRLSLTEEGRHYLSHCRELLDALETAEEALTAGAQAARGVLRVNAPVSYGIRHLADLWAPFLAQHPALRLEVTLSDRAVDLIEDGVDVAIRIGRLEQSSLIARRLATTGIRLCAAPSYLAVHGQPEHPRDLVEHRVIGYSYWAGGDDWVFESDAGPQRVRVQPQMQSNNGETCVAAAVAGGGIVLQPDFLVDQALQAGALVELLPAYQLPVLGVYAVYPSRRQLATKVRALLAYLTEQLGASA